MNRLSIRDFDNLPKFLHAYTKAQKSLSKHWTISRWSKKMGLKDTSSITKVINGQRKIGPKLEAKLIKSLLLNEDEASHFRALVLLDKVTGSKPVNFKHLSILKSKEATAETDHWGQAVKVGPSDPALALYKSWYAAIIRELALIPNLELTAAKISALLTPTVPDFLVKRAVADLESAGLVKVQANLIQAVNPSTIDTTSDLPIGVVRRFHRLGLDLAKDAIESMAPIEREFQMNAFPIATRRLAIYRPEVKLFFDWKQCKECSSEWAAAELILTVALGFDREAERDQFAIAGAHKLVERAQDGSCGVFDVY